MSFSVPESHPEYIIFSCPLSLGSSWLWQCFNDPCLMTLTALQNIGDVFLRMPHCYNSSGVFLRRPRMWISKRKTTGVKCHFHYILSNTHILTWFIIFDVVSFLCCQVTLFFPSFQTVWSHSVQLTPQEWGVRTSLNCFYKFYGGFLCVYRSYKFMSDLSLSISYLVLAYNLYFLCCRKWYFLHFDFQLFFATV